MKTNRIIIVGGGSAGWMTAATLIRAFPEKDISVIESPDIATVGVGESTLGQLRRWTRFIGLDEKDFMRYTDASYKMSIKFTDFYKKDYGSFHYPFGRPMTYSDENSIKDWGVLRHYNPELPATSMVDYLFPAAQLWESNRISDNESGEFGNFNFETDVAYHFDAAKFGAWLKNNYCLPRGVKHIPKTVINIETDNQGIKYLDMNDGEKVFSDLFIDCTGFKSILLAGALKEPFTSYEDILPNNRAWATRIEYKNKEQELELFTNSTAIGNGWVWNIPLWSRIGTGYVYSDKFIDPEDAKDEFKQYLMSDKMIVPRTKEEVDSLIFNDIHIRVGIHRKSFVKNVVAIGLSSGFIEPLESNGLFSVHEFLFVLVDILQRGVVNQFDRDIYNSEVSDMFDGFAKFVAMHYALSARDDTPYWKAVRDRDYSENRNDTQYVPYLHRNAAFYHAGRNYLDSAQPLDPSGITYILTGMEYPQMNSAKINELEYALGKDHVINKAKKLHEAWNDRLESWKISAKNSKTAVEFLRERFYSEP